MRDVATVVDSVEERAQKTYSNGVQGAMIVVQKQSGANSVAISQKVIDMLPQLQKSLPSDVKLGIIVNTSDNILNTIDSLEETIMYAMLFVILVVFVFLGRWRATVIICITIPMSLVASFIYLGIIDGGSLNIISLSCLSIAIGNVVEWTSTVYTEAGVDAMSDFNPTLQYNAPRSCHTHRSLDLCRNV